MEILFHGAAQQVTGSMYHLTLDSGYQILVDCGLDYEKTSSREQNLNFPFNPKDLDVVVLTHAHIDHSGNLPTLFRKGFSGQVICTEPTAALADILLMDSANIELGKYKRSKYGKKKAVRLYGFKDVFSVMESIVTLPFNKPFRLHPQAELTLIPAGHILGAASLQFKIEEKGVSKTVTFSGDLGPNDVPIVVNPQIPETDYLIMEGTYGDRERKDTVSPEEILEKHIISTCIERGGNLIIPAFSVGRTQSILHCINRLYRKSNIPRIQVFADSPLGLNSGEIHTKNLAFLNPEAQQFYKDHNTLFSFKQSYFVEDEYDENYMSKYSNSCIIVSSAGMMEGGRIKEHIARNIHDAKSTILVAGYCSPGTLGHELQHKKNVFVKNQMYQVFAHVEATDVFSAHPDKKGLISYVKSAQAKRNIKKMFLAHGELQSLQHLKESLSTDIEDITIPKKGDIFKI